MTSQRNGAKVPRLWCGSIKAVITRIIVNKGGKAPVNSLLGGRKSTNPTCGFKASALLICRAYYCTFKTKLHGKDKT